jgi:hypothetical protein
MAMADITELVDLPDPSVQQLVHPIDVDAAAFRYRFGWLIGLLTAPAVALAVGVVAWRLGAGYVLPVVAGLSTAALGRSVSRAHIEASWAYVPYRRQDRSRALPPRWQLVAGAVSGFAIVIAVALAAPALAAPTPAGLRQWVLGAGAATAALLAVDLASSALLGRGSYVSRLWYALPIVLGVAVAVMIAWSTLADSLTSLMTLDAALGALFMLAVGGALAAWQLVERRRPLSGGAA